MICSLCGENQIGFSRIVQRPQYTACFPCLDSLVENEIESRGVKEEARRSAEYHSGSPTAEDREREQLRDAGRIP